MVETLDSVDVGHTPQAFVAYTSYIRGWVEWKRSGNDSALHEIRQSMEAWIGLEEPQWIESGRDQLARVALFIGDYQGALDQAMAVDMKQSWQFAKETALTAAMLLRDREAMRRATDGAAEYTIPGRKREGLALLAEAGWAVLENRTDDAVGAFTRLIELVKNHFTAERLQETRALFAILVPEAPAARAAAEMAYEEITAAGAFHLVEVWKDAFPPTVIEEAG